MFMMSVASYCTCNVTVIAVGGTVLCLYTNSLQCHVLNSVGHELYDGGSKVRCPFWQFAFSLCGCNELLSTHAATVFALANVAHNRACNIEVEAVGSWFVSHCHFLKAESDETSLSLVMEGFSVFPLPLAHFSTHRWSLMSTRYIMLLMCC